MLGIKMSAYDLVGDTGVQALAPRFGGIFYSSLGAYISQANINDSLHWSGLMKLGPFQRFPLTVEMYSVLIAPFLVFRFIK